MSDQIEPGMKFVAIGEVLRLATVEDLKLSGHMAHSWSKNPWPNNKYVTNICGKEFILCIDQPEEFLRLVKAAKYFDQEWDRSPK